MTCCGQPRTTRFCPECGRKIDANPPLASLLWHCRRTEQLNQERLDRLASADGPGDSSPGMEKSIAQVAAVRDKWKSWGDALAAAMDRIAELEAGLLRIAEIDGQNP